MAVEIGEGGRALGRDDPSVTSALAGMRTVRDEVVDSAV